MDCSIPYYIKPYKKSHHGVRVRKWMHGILISPWQPRKECPPLVRSLSYNLVTKSGDDWFCFNVTCFELVGAQPLISFTFSGGLFFALLCIFKLIFFGLLTNHAGVAAVPCLTLMHHRTHTVVSSIRNPTPPCPSRGKNERSNVRVYTYALCKGGQIALNSKFGPPISNLLTLTQRLCNDKLRRMDSLAGGN